jgi:ferric-dicitrate binding protein FerR (iron transport regulator)
VGRSIAGLAAAAAIALGITFFVQRTPDQPVDTRAYLLTAAGGVTVQGSAGFVPAAANYKLPAGTVIRTSDAGEAQIGFADGTTRVTLKAGAELRFLQGGSDKRLELRRGTMEGSVPAQEGELTVATRESELKVSEGLFRFQASPAFDRVEVKKGSATLSRQNRSVRVAADHFAVAGEGLALASKPLDPSGPAGSVRNAVATIRHAQGGVFLFTQTPADRIPVKAGQSVLEGQSLLAEGTRASAILEYPDGTRLETAPDTIIRRFTDPKDRTRKDVLLEQGAVVADVAKQPAGRPMTVGTSAAVVTVVGTRFTLAADREGSRLQVEEGVVKFARLVGDRKEIEVRSGYGAVAAPGRPFEPTLVPGGVQYLEIDLASGVTDGDGEWAVDGLGVRQRKAAAGTATTHLFKASTEESVVLEAVAEVEPGLSGPSGEWGFGLAAAFRDRNLVLRTRQGAEGGSVFEFKDVTSRPFEHGREGTYRLKLRIERAKGTSRAKLQGKMWQGDREPDGWMIEDDLELEGPLTHVGFQTLRCACAFKAFRVRVLRQEP